MATPNRMKSGRIQESMNPASPAKEPVRPAEPQKAVVELAVQGKVTNFGEDIFVQIDGKEYPIQWKSTDTWYGRLELPLNKEIRYRYVMKRAGQEVDRTSLRTRVFSKSPVQDSWN